MADQRKHRRLRSHIPGPEIIQLFAHILRRGLQPAFQGAILSQDRLLSGRPYFLVGSLVRRTSLTRGNALKRYTTTDTRGSLVRKAL
jgi:hypothetical protein